MVGESILACATNIGLTIYGAVLEMGVWPPGVGLQGQAPNHLMLLYSKDAVVSDEEKAAEKPSGELREDERKRTAEDASKRVQTLSKRVVVSSTRMSSGDTCLRPERQPLFRRHDLLTGFSMERGNLNNHSYQ